MEGDFETKREVCETIVIFPKFPVNKPLKGAFTAF